MMIDKNNQNNVNSPSYLINNLNKININRVNQNNESKINLIHWNCNSINNKIEEFRSFCLLYKPHIISLNETKMCEFKADYLLKVDNYTTLHRPRSLNTNGGGGVALLIRNDVEYSENKILDDLNLETCVINIIINKINVNIVSFYNPPHLTINK
jgi:exonuclease III